MLNYENQIAEIKKRRSKKRRRKNAAGRPPSGAINPKTNQALDIQDQGGSIGYDVDQGVNVSWLMAHFKKDRVTVNELLAGVRPIRIKKGGVKIYNFLEAAECLVIPKKHIHEYLNRVGPKDLPHELQVKVWDAETKKFKFMEMSKHHWLTEDVVEYFGIIFKTIKINTQLWMNTIDNNETVSETQRNLLQALIDDLLIDLHKNISKILEENTYGNAYSRYLEKDNNFEND